MNILQKSYKKALQYEEKIIDEKFGRIDKIWARTKKLVHILCVTKQKIMIDDLSRAIHGSVETVSDIIHAVYLVDIFFESTMGYFMVLVHVITDEEEANVPDRDMQLIFVKSGYLLGRYIPTL